MTFVYSTSIAFALGIVLGAICGYLIGTDRAKRESL